MLIVSHVCAEFRSAGGAAFTITPSMIHGFIEAPEFIREDPLFQLLLQDGSVESSVSETRKRVLENDPDDGLDGSGKAAKPARPARSPKSKAESSETETPTP